MAMRARASRSRLPPRLAIGLPKATRLVERSQASSSAFSARPIRRMQWCTRPGPSRPWAISKARPGPARIALAGRRTPRRVTSPWPSGSSYWPSAVSIRSTVTPGASSGTTTIECWRCRWAVGVGEAHEDADLAVGVTGAGRPPLATVEHDVVAVEGGRGLHVRRVGARDAGLGHEERAAHPPVEQGLEPLLLLLGGAVAQQHLHVAGVGGVAVEHQRGQRRAAGLLGDRGVVGVAEPGAAVGAEAGGVGVAVPGREEQVPQALLARPWPAARRRTAGGGQESSPRARRAATSRRMAGSTGSISVSTKARTRAARSAARGDGAKSMSLTLDRC